MRGAALPTAAADITEKAAPGWQARLRLGFTARDGRTLLSERSHHGPLTVQRPFYPEGHTPEDNARAGPCHVYLLHPPGGVVGGDRLDLSLTVHERAHALITTPGATKFYRSAGPPAHQRQALEVTDGALEWLPQENILFPGARLRLENGIHLRGEARFLGWEIHCLGRPAIGERFEPGTARFRLALHRDDRPLLLDRWQVEGAAGLDGPAGLRGHPVVATLLATPADPTALEAARAALPESPEGVAGATLVDGLLVVRFLGHQAEAARRCFVPVWRALRPLLLGRPACPPRIWAT